MQQRKAIRRTDFYEYCFSKLKFHINKSRRALIKLSTLTKSINLIKNIKNHQGPKSFIEFF